MKIDWDKARLIAAHRFEDVIIACNRRDEDDLRAFMESGLALPEEYMIEDEPEKRYKYLDENNCFMSGAGYICAMIEFTTPVGNHYLLPCIANKQDNNNKVQWTIVPYKVEIGPEYKEKLAILYTDELNDAINAAITKGMHPVTYDEVKADAMV